MKSVEQLSIDTIRILAAETVQKANSGHPGLPLGAADAAFALWAKIMKHNPKNPKFQDRDRFVLSAGHGSSLIYTLLHLSGYDLTIEDLKNFRQLDSLTPGHPEFKHTDGVEVTTGPLGQGIANAVGMAWAESYLASKFNRPGFEIVDHYTYALCGDGCMMEGVASEAASIAGTMGLGKLVLLYDSNKITIEGSTDITFCEDVSKRFEAYGWHVQVVENGNDYEQVLKAINEAKKVTDKPSLIEFKTEIAYSSPNKQGKASAHGEPLGVEEIKLIKQNAGFDLDKEFYVPEQVQEYFCQVLKENENKEAKWNETFASYKETYPELYDEWNLWNSGDLSVDLLENDDFWNCEGNIASRASSEKILNKLSALVPNLIGGSADLAPSTKTVMKDRKFYSKTERDGSNLHFGIREHAMTAIANGMALHGGLKPYISGFFVFSDYMKPAMRLSALMNLPVINILTHDSIGVGEDGPTHQPIEHLAALRSIPNFTVLRPCDFNETAAAWYLAITRNDSPSALVLSRQNLKMVTKSGKDALKGAYILRDSENPEIIIMASGSEVALAVEAYDELISKGIKARVVSMMSFEIFEEQSTEYKESVLPNAVRARLAIEAASEFGWHKYVGLDGKIIAMNGFGASAPAEQLFKKFGFTTDNVVKSALSLLK